MSDVGFSFADYSPSVGGMYDYLSQPVDSYISGSVDYAPDGWDSPVGPQSNGTYGIPVTAQQRNSPQNTAGWSSSISQSTADLLKYGIGALGQLGMAKMQVDYARAEATNGGLFYQGRPALLGRNGLGMVSGGMNLSVLLLIAGGAWLLLRKG